jgi:hypothetical protein
MEFICGNAETLGGQPQKFLERRGGREPKRGSFRLYAFAARRVAFVARRQRGIALDECDLSKPDVQLLGHNLRERRLNTRAEFHLSAIDQNFAALANAHPGIYCQ